MLEKIKDFFSPIKGGYLDGYTFKKFMMSFQRIGVTAILILFMVLVYRNGEEYTAVLELFLSGILILQIYKGIFEKWYFLKNLYK